MIETKKVIVIDDKVVAVLQDDNEPSDLPVGATIERREMQYTLENGWREIGWTPPLSEIEQLKLEQAQANAELVQLIMMMSGGPV